MSTTATVSITRTTSAQSIVEEPLAPSQAFLREKIQRKISKNSVNSVNTASSKRSKLSTGSKYVGHPEGHTALSTPSLLPDLDPNTGLVSEAGANVDANKANDAKDPTSRKNYRLALAAIYWCFFAMGLDIGSTGPLLPTYQKTYNVNFMTVSAIFICGCTVRSLFLCSFDLTPSMIQYLDD